MTPILEVVVGSTVHGTAVNDGLEDLDLMTIYMESLAEHFSLHHPLNESWQERTKPAGVRSEAGDVDRACYTLRRYIQLALSGNPTILLALFAPPEFTRIETFEGRELRGMKGALLSRRMYNPFRGYMVQQQERLLGLRGQKRCTRPELIERYGYDTKYASHVVRLGLQGFELLSTGHLTLPMPGDDRELVREIRLGKYPLTEVTEMIGWMFWRLDSARNWSPLPEAPDVDTVEGKLIDAYWRHWGCTAAMKNHGAIA